LFSFFDFPKSCVLSENVRNGTVTNYVTERYFLTLDLLKGTVSRDFLLLVFS
jgi:hypothetical protein